MSFRQILAVVAALNFMYFGVEFTAAWITDSVALFADSADFLEDTSINLLILLAAGWTIAARARVGAALACLLMIPLLATLVAAISKLMNPVPPVADFVLLAALGALAVNSVCAWLLARFRQGSGSLSKAAFLSARNDVAANIAIMAAAGLTMLWPSIWPDLIAGVGIGLLNADAAREVWQAAKVERAASPQGSPPA